MKNNVSLLSTIQFKEIRIICRSLQVKLRLCVKINFKKELRNVDLGTKNVQG